MSNDLEKEEWIFFSLRHAEQFCSKHFLQSAILFLSWRTLPDSQETITIPWDG